MIVLSPGEVAVFFSLIVSGGRNCSKRKENGETSTFQRRAVVRNAKMQIGRGGGIKKSTPKFLDRRNNGWGSCPYPCKSSHRLKYLSKYYSSFNSCIQYRTHIELTQHLIKKHIEHQAFIDV